MTYLADLAMAITDHRTSASSTQLSGTMQTLFRRVLATNATIGACRPGQFRCHNGRCIPDHWVCNHQQDCPGAEDEPARCRESRSTASVDANTPTLSPTFFVPRNLSIICPSLSCELKLTDCVVRKKY